MGSIIYGRHAHLRMKFIMTLTRYCLLVRPFTLDQVVDDPHLEEDFKPYGVIRVESCIASQLVLTFDGAMSLPNFNPKEDSEWPTMKNGDTVNYSDNVCYKLVHETLSCTGVMSTTATIELKDAQNAKRSSKNYGARRRESLRGVKMDEEIKKLRSSITANEDDHAKFSMSDTSKMKSPLRWYHVLRISGELLNPLVLFLVILQLVVILLYWLLIMLITIIFWVAAYPLTVWRTL